MSTYRIQMHVTVQRTVEVEADTQEEAKRKADAFDVTYEGPDEDVLDWERWGAPKLVED